VSGLIKCDECAGDILMEDFVVCHRCYVKMLREKRELERHVERINKAQKEVRGLRTGSTGDGGALVPAVEEEELSPAMSEVLGLAPQKDKRCEEQGKDKRKV
jgi:hypothetical protein